MCGIAGFWDLNNKFRPDNLKNIIVKMKDCLKERGPDDSNYWIDKKNNISLGHTRLSIIETSILGRQPMISQNKRYVIVFNGEIYNFPSLKQELQNSNIKTKSNSDTEILLEACSHWGVKKTLLKLSGMFAFALLDKKIMKLYLARDKFGIKPLYYSLKNNIFLFSSQTKSFLKHPHWKKEICLKTLGDYLRYGYIPTGKSIYKNTAQVLPGHYLILNANGFLEKRCYWNIRKKINENENITINDVENMLESSVKEHMISDVPIGSFLSGGIDSSLITSLMQKNSIKPIETFSIGFHDKSLDESGYASSVANHLKTNHNQVIFSDKDLINLIPKINNIYDEPFADSSQLPTILLSKITRKKVKVALSGDGGDELFGGYNRYNWAKKINIIYKLPKFLRLLFFNAIKNISTNSWDKIFRNTPYFNKIQFAGDKIYKLADASNLKSFSDVYPNLISQWKLEEVPLLKSDYSNEDFNKSLPSLDIIKQMQLADILTYLPGDILTKVDRASMSYGLEVRVPFLQNKLIDNIWSIKDKDKKNKNILKKILYKYVPKKLVSRPKMGFSIPLDKWLRGPLKDWAEDLLKDKKLEENFLDSKKIRTKWKEHLSEKRNWQYPLWTVLIYQSWKNC